MKKQREIKFRIWDNDKKGFHFLDGIWNMPDPCYDGEIQQFTGLKDVNGKDIFEGDICKCFTLYEKKVFISAIEWGHAGFVVKQPAPHSCLEGFYTLELEHFHYEIIGNQFENPELLRS